jgi:hypothetical protein
LLVRSSLNASLRRSHFSSSPLLRSEPDEQEPIPQTEGLARRAGRTGRTGIGGRSGLDRRTGVGRGRLRREKVSGRAGSSCTQDDELTKCTPPEVEGSTRALQGRLAKWSICVVDLLEKELALSADVEARKWAKDGGHTRFVQSLCDVTERAGDFNFAEDRPEITGYAEK